MIEFRRILCPIDFSDTSIRALTYAAAFASWYQAQLEVMHVVPVVEYDLAPVPPGTAADMESIRSAARDAAVAEIRRAVAAAGVADVVPGVFAREGRAHETIVERAEAQAADLIVMGTHGRSGFNRLLLGSVAEKVLRAAACPVLTVPPAAPPMAGSPAALRRILCPVDFSPSSQKALGYALDLGRQAGGRVTVLHALEYMDPEEPCEHVDFDIRKARQYFIDQARLKLHAAVARESTTWCEIEEVLAIGRAYQVILHQAATSPADLIVMGAQGAAGVELMLYGSNTQHVVRAATCPVLGVRA